MSGNAYAPFTNTVALESMPVVAPDVNGANVTHGTDAANTAPVTKYGLGTAFADVWDTFFGKGPIVETPKAAAERKINEPSYILPPLIWSVLLVVIGILLLSRGFGLLGEEGEGVVVNLSDTGKYPGIAHGIKAIKGKAKTAALAAAE